MSVLGIKALVKERNFFFPEMKIQAEKIDFELKTIEENKAALKNIRTLNLATFGKVDFRIQGSHQIFGHKYAKSGRNIIRSVHANI